MYIPPFKEFLVSLDQDEFSKRIFLETGMQIFKTNDQSISEKEGELFEAIYKKAVLDGFKASRILLEEYHKWLSEYLL